VSTRHLQSVAVRQQLYVGSSVGSMVQSLVCPAGVACQYRFCVVESHTDVRICTFENRRSSLVMSTQGENMKRLSTLVAALLVVLAACGGASDTVTEDVGDQTETTQVDTTQAVDDDGVTEETTPPADDSGDENADDSNDAEGEGPSTATVTLGDETYDFSTEGAPVAQCRTDLFGIYSVQLPLIDENGAIADGSVAIVALREGTDPETVGEVNSVRLDIGDEIWLADEASEVLTQTEGFEPGMSQVESVEIEGRTVRGTATFIRQGSLFGGGEVETLTGTFEATCGEERIT
jgi:hypothetical protein